MRTLHVVLPEGVDDSARPSGGNRYDRRVCDGLAVHGWRVVVHEVAEDHLAATLAGLPDDASVLVDGLVACGRPAAVVPAAARLRITVLVHLPLGVASGSARAGERDVLLAARHVIATSGWTREWLRRHYDLPVVHVARPGVDPAPVAPGSRSGRALLTVGRASRAKGYDVLVAALGSLTHLAWSSTWVGPLEDRGRPSAAGAPPRHGAVRHTGPLPPAAVAAHYRAADLLVLPSRTETYGMVLTEALARGLPVVASDVGGVREALGRTPTGRVPGLLVPPEDPELLAVALRRWLTEPYLRAELRLRARERRRTLTGWSGTIAAIADVLDAYAEVAP